MSARKLRSLLSPSSPHPSTSPHLFINIKSQLLAHRILALNKQLEEASILHGSEHASNKGNVSCMDSRDTCQVYWHRRLESWGECKSCLVLCKWVWVTGASEVNVLQFICQWARVCYMKMDSLLRPWLLLVCDYFSFPDLLATLVPPSLNLVPGSVPPPGIQNVELRSERGPKHKLGNAAERKNSFNDSFTIRKRMFGKDA